MAQETLSDIFRRISLRRFDGAPDNLPDYLDWLPNRPYENMHVRSAGELLNSALTPVDRNTVKKVLMLGSGMGFEFVSARMVFPGAEILGVDTRVDLKNSPVVHHMQKITGAGFLPYHMEDTGRVQAVMPDPDLLVVRHPLCEQSIENLRYYGENLKPWLIYLKQTGMTGLISFYYKEKRWKGQFIKYIIKPMYKEMYDHIASEGNKGNQETIYYADEGYEIVPDYWWIRIN